MQYKNNQGFLLVSLLVVVAVVGGLYFMKDKNGTNYLTVLKTTVQGYIDNKQLNPIERARNAKALMDKNQQDLEKQVEEN
jgi:Tfp pilus assembly protein PilE